MSDKTKKTILELKAEDSAVIIKADGTAEILLPDKPDSEPMDEPEMLALGIMFALNDEVIMNQIWDLVEQKESELMKQPVLDKKDLN